MGTSLKRYLFFCWIGRKMVSGPLKMATSGTPFDTSNLIWLEASKKEPGHSQDGSGMLCVPWKTPSCDVKFPSTWGAPKTSNPFVALKKMVRIPRFSRYIFQKNNLPNPIHRSFLNHLSPHQPWHQQRRRRQRTADLVLRQEFHKNLRIQGRLGVQQKGGGKRGKEKFPPAQKKKSGLTLKCQKKKTPKVGGILGCFFCL